MRDRACAHAAWATAWSCVRSADSHVNPSPMANQSTPRRSRRTRSSPTCHFPDLRNWTTLTGQPRATRRTTMPNPAVDLPFPSPVFTTTSLFTWRRSGVTCSVGTSARPIMDPLLPDGEDDGTAAVLDDAHARAVVAGQVLLGQHLVGGAVDDDAATVEQHEP